LVVFGNRNNPPPIYGGDGFGGFRIGFSNID